jgi:hypothetical protein
MLERIADKWTLLVIDALDSRKELRFSQLRERVDAAPATFSEVNLLPENLDPDKSHFFGSTLLAARATARYQ